MQEGDGERTGALRAYRWLVSGSSLGAKTKGSMRSASWTRQAFSAPRRNQILFSQCECTSITTARSKAGMAQQQRVRQEEGG